MPKTPLHRRARWKVEAWLMWNVVRHLPTRVRCALGDHDFVGSIPPGYWYADSAYCKHCGEDQR